MTADISVALKQTAKTARESDDAIEAEEVDDSIFGEDEFESDVTIIDSALSYFKIHDSTFKKCKGIWNKQSRSTTMADYIKLKLGVYLKIAVDTRWNSLLDATKHLMSFIKEKPAELKAVFTKFKLDYFNTEEISFKIIFRYE